MIISSFIHKSNLNCTPQAPWGLDLPWPPFLPLPLLWRLWRLPCLRAPDQQARQGVEDGVGGWA